MGYEIRQRSTTLANGTFYDREGNRWYRDPANPSQVYAGVTSILNVRAAPGLEKAKRNGIAKYAAKNRKELAEGTQAHAEALLREQDVVLPDWRIATDFGTAVHTVTDNLLQGRPLDEGLEHVEGSKTYPVSNTFTEFVPRYWDEFLTVFDVEFVDSEQVVVSDEWGYAGRFDHVLKVNGKLVLVDTKSNKNGPNGKVALQNSAYGNADCIMDMTTGKRTPMHQVQGSYVFWIREEGWNLFPLEYTEHTFGDFRKHLDLFAYGAVRSDSELVGEPLYEGGILPVKW